MAYPPALYAALDAEFSFDFDPCPYPLPHGFDGLTCEWGRSNYVNPPFGSIIHQGRKKGPTAWVRKAIAEWRKGKTVVLVYPIDKWVLMLLGEILGPDADVRNLGDCQVGCHGRRLCRQGHWPPHRSLHSARRPGADGRAAAALFAWGGRRVIWHLSHRADPFAAAIADRHYSRQKPGTPQFVPPGRCIVLRAGTVERGAYWTTSWPFGIYVRHRWPGAWMCSAFRNEGAGVASEMIRQAVAATRFYFGSPPPARHGDVRG